MVREASTPLVQHHVEPFLGGEILADVRLDLIRQVMVVQNADLHVEDGSFLGPAWAAARSRT
jgi:hypothetical protein